MVGVRHPAMWARNLAVPRHPDAGGPDFRFVGRRPSVVEMALGDGAVTLPPSPHDGPARTMPRRGGQVVVADAPIEDR